MAANVTGCSLPENTSKSNFFEAECNGSDELAGERACAALALCQAHRGMSRARPESG